MKKKRIEKKSSILKKELEKTKLEEFKLMWYYANWEWRIIILIGIGAIIYFIYRLWDIFGLI
ncbi:hypothetical protein COU53_00645 [Candidatus Pacearchaeota archaeon CG10_big_fil_rev_8_21_14_0_10_30_48]|nr:MAG: hypothetical protein COU53_00645 [Candidatus Pacearchaeota archaeon CG10_big_fil_rev_8_21_14_0_10_30_48]